MKDAGYHPELVCNKHGIYRANFTDPRGKRVRRSLKTRDFKLAQISVKKLMVEAYQKGYFEMKRPAKMTFGELAVRVLKYALDRRKSYKKVYVPIMKHLVDSLGKKNLQEIEKPLVESYQIERSKHVSKQTVNHELKILKRCFNLAMQWKLCFENPVKGVEFFPIPQRPVRYLSLEEMQRLINSAVGYIQQIILFALHTGARKGEILSVKWANIDFDNRLVVFQKTKNDLFREIPLTDTLYTMLMNRRLECPKTEYVFTGSNGKPFGKVDKSFWSVLRKAGIENFRFHDMRHTYASQLVMGGVDILTVKELLGHKDLKTTLIYAHLAPKHKREAMKTYEAHLCKIISVNWQGIGNV